MTDIRDVLQALPYPPDDGTAYALTDLFTVRHRIIRELDPQPRSVFEFGALLGFFLVTALDAAPSITDVGWVDNEQHTEGSNGMCSVNVGATRAVGQVWFTDRDEATTFLAASTPNGRRWTASGTWDLVQVDSDHSYDGCLADLDAAALLEPRWIMVDDWTADGHREAVQAATLNWVDEQHHAAGVRWELTEHETVNGLALLTRQP